MSFKWCFIFLSFLNLLLGYNADYETVKKICEEQQTCSACLQTQTCMWCAATGSVANYEPSIRCVTRDKYKDPNVWCPVSQIINDSTVMIFKENLPLFATKNTTPIQIQQIQPQVLRLRLRIGEEYNFTLKYSHAEDYPVDLYYLMDLSSSMSQYREDLSELGVDLASAMRHLTRNFRLGFGSFVDKVELPMTDTLPEKLKKPCNEDIVHCAPPYGYKHQMNLTEDADSFKTNVQAAPLSGNLDGPEGGFDAIMQAMVCTERIGWRKDGRHLLVFSTDANFHVAGDGRLAGIIEPNDCECHLDKEGTYTHSSLLDYPSISQINRIALKNNINIIFAVPQDVSKTYQRLSECISGSAIGVIKKNDTVNVINLIQKEYEKLVDKVKMIDNAKKPITLRYFSKCLDKKGEVIERSECQGFHFGDIIQFEISIKATDCPTNPDNWQQLIEIKPQGLENILKIELELICDCPCDKSNYEGYVIKSEKCNYQGDLNCGICKCNDGFYGKHCICSGNETQSNIKDDCRASDNDNSDCSNHGTCQCGRCECEIRENPAENFSGKYCECNNFSCLRDNDQLCGGHGNCTCGTCVCMPGWSGLSCGCHDNSTCFPPGDNTKICSGHGTCDCGKCHCDNDVFYSGGYCQDCPTCSEVHCSKLKECVECFAFNTGSRLKNGTCERCYDDVEIVAKIDKVDVNEADYQLGYRVCHVPTDNGCSFDFKYRIESHRGDMPKSYITVEENKKCPKSIPIFTVAISVIVSTVIIGFLILLIWKIVTMVHDQREYAKFEKERAMAKWERGDNPLYKQATTTFSNPTFTESRQS
ncbi:hypothetical protein PV328_009304 [Microctonus aethiopoides]|uniref:Integrin beta n=2 Tax=Microctonus aethiopoides TaxID=144406 RepID=A0AA39EYV4_9HYME|nr:hypothetical protein PV328_009304 [Microctonus aethiopoides]